MSQCAPDGQAGYPATGTGAVRVWRRATDLVRRFGLWHRDLRSAISNARHQAVIKPEPLQAPVQGGCSRACGGPPGSRSMM
jgi:hypothetical protein